MDEKEISQSITASGIIAKMRKAQEEQNKKIEDEKARAAKEKAEREAAEAARIRKEREEQERLERERLAEEQRQKAEEERRRIESETAARIEAEQKAEEERKKQQYERTRRTVEVSAQVDSLVYQIEGLLKNPPKSINYSFSKIQNEVKFIDGNDVDFDRMENYQKLKSIYQQFDILRIKLEEKQTKRLKQKKVFKILGLIILSILILGAVIFGVKYYTSTDFYKTKQTLSQQKKIEVKAVKAEKQRIKKYKVGAWGEAGIIFYDKGEYSDGWRFLEMSPDRFNDICFADYYPSVTGIKKELGGGYENTQLLVNELGSSSAAGWASSYEVNGKDDWYLGNVAEMKMCFNNLVKNKKNRKKLDKFIEEGRLVKYYSTYWEWNQTGTMTYITSEPVYPDKCYTVIFSTSRFTLDGGKEKTIGVDWRGFDTKIAAGYKNYVRPIRRF